MPSPIICKIKCALFPKQHVCCRTYLDIAPEVLDTADHPDAELVDNPDVELDRLLMLLILRLLEVRLTNHASANQPCETFFNKFTLKSCIRSKTTQTQLQLFSISSFSCATFNLATLALVQSVLFVEESFPYRPTLINKRIYRITFSWGEGGEFLLFTLPLSLQLHFLNSI